MAEQLGVVGAQGPVGPTGPQGPGGFPASGYPAVGAGVSLGADNQASINTGYSPVTAALFSGMIWILSYNGSGGINCRLLSNSNGSNNGFAFGTSMTYGNAPMQILVGTPGGGYVGLTDSFDIASYGTWTCLVFVADHTDLHLYHNGVQVASTPMSELVLASAAINIGWGSGGGAWNGRFAHAAVWPESALTPGQVQDLYLYALAGNQEADYESFVESLSPALYYPMQETSGNILTNHGTTGSANNATISNTWSLAVTGGPVIGDPVVATGPGQPTSVTLTSGTAYQNPNTWDVWLRVPVTYNPTSTAAASLAVGVGSTAAPAQVTEHTVPAGAVVGAVHTTVVYVPAQWYALVTETNATLGTATVVSV